MFITICAFMWISTGSLLFPLWRVFPSSINVRKACECSQPSLMQEVQKSVDSSITSVKFVTLYDDCIFIISYNEHK